MKRIFGTGKKGGNMDAIQEKQITNIVSHLQNARELLDGLMYGSIVTDGEYKKLRKCYDNICKALDEL